MKVPANLSADRLILEYLSRVTQAATRYLPKGGRLAFVGRTRARIERECGPAGLGDPARVKEVLDALGSPEDLVKQERARLDAAWVKRRARDKQAGEAAAASIPEPLQRRPINSRWRPATDTQPLALRPRPGQPGGRPGRAGGGTGAALEGMRSRLRAMRGGRPAGGSRDDVPGTGGTGPPGGAEAQPPAEPELRVLEGTVIETPPAADTPPGTGHQQPPGTGHEADPGAGSQPGAPSTGQPANLAAPAPVTSRLPGGRLMLRGGAGALAGNVGRWAREAGSMSRRYPLEAAVVILLGVGGLILPFPFWLIGGILAVFSRFWMPRDKWIALTGPLVIALLGTAVTAVIVRGQGNPVEIYTHALSLDVGYLLRAGSVLCAARLFLQVRRGRRERVPPWRR